MVGNNLYTVGIIVKCGYDGSDSNGNDKIGWAAEVDFEDGGFCNTDSCKGNYGTKYFCPTLDEAVQNVLDGMKMLNIKRVEEISDTNMKTAIYYYQDGETEEYPPPANWKEELKKSSEKYNLRFPY